MHQLGEYLTMGLSSQLAQGVLGHVQGIALGTEGGIAQTWATRCKTVTSTVPTIAPWARATVTAKARLVAKLARRFAITASETCRGNFGAFLAWAVITPHRHHWLGHRFSHGFFYSHRGRLDGRLSAAVGRRFSTGPDTLMARASTDMGNVSQVIPAIHPYIGIDSLPAVNHQPEFAAATITSAAETAITQGALALAGTVVDAASPGFMRQRLLRRAV
jgi:metal-dependent amidase/aminoacylase/carboxypeptidase family protein